MKQSGGVVAPSVLAVASNRASQSRAAATLVRPGEVAAIAAQLAPAVGFWGAAEVDLVASFLRRLQYLPDALRRDVWQAPLATLSRGGGDCEDLGIVGLSLLLAMGGYGALVVGIMYARRGPIGHAWLEGWDSAGWFHLEATTAAVTRFARPPAYVPHAVYTP